MAENIVLKRVTGKTKVMFILADPVDHVVGTALLNEHFFQNSLDICASPLNITAEDLPGTLAAIRRMRNVIGFGVTIPHKIAILQHLDEVTKRAANVGAVNFVRRDGTGRLTGDNVDGVGFIAGLKRNGVEAKGRRVLQLGAGGAGRAIAFALAEEGAVELTIANRSPDKAIDLARSVEAAYPACRCAAGPADPAHADLVVNTTSVGMHEGDSLPVDPSLLSPEMFVADVIMRPETTPLLIEAERRGCKIIRGKEMLLDQMRLVQQFLEL